MALFMRMELGIGEERERQLVDMAESLSVLSGLVGLVEVDQAEMLFVEVELVLVVITVLLMVPCLGQLTWVVLEVEVEPCGPPVEGVS